MLLRVKAHQMDTKASQTASFQSRMLNDLLHVGCCSKMSAAGAYFVRIDICAPALALSDDKKSFLPFSCEQVIRIL